jgi:AcrR family transcriptional regulator
MKGFSDDERERIRSELVEAGRELFAQFGPERTRIKDITEAVGIGTSTFYQFFDSKEALYVEVLLVEQERLNRRIVEEIEGVDDTREQVRITIREVISGAESNPLINQLVVEGELQSLEAENPADGLDRPDQGLASVEAWIDDPSLRYDDARLVNGLLRGLAFVVRSEAVISDAESTAEYDAVRDALVDVVVDGLFEGE